ncbi:aspartate aminotransferase family protein [Aestuariivirga sp.]|uniref:aspartate aminotransferase family protein n=1 Tax=Aestuariivirga sp. TaxID=2650926 RepID=UPI003919295E
MNQDIASAVAEAEEQYVAAHPQCARLANAASEHLPGGNTRTTVFFSPFPLFIESGKGSVLTDMDGNRYVDFINEFTAALFGHSNEVVIQTIAETAKKGMNFGAQTKHEALLAAEIRRRFPAMELLRFCNSGTEANLLAIAAARAVTGKSKALIFDSAYHGGLYSFGAQSAPLNMPIPYVMSSFNDTEAVTRDIRTHAPDLAVVIVEPLQGGAGAIPGEQGFLHAVREETRRNGVLLLFDEVMTSRTGWGGMQARYGIKPDLVTLGKYIAGGMTIGAFGGRGDIMKRFDPAVPGSFPHGGTFNNNVLAMAAGYAALSQVLTEERVTAVNSLGDMLQRELRAVSAANGVPMTITGLGSVFGIHFHEGSVRNALDLRRGEVGREAGIAALKKLFQFDMLKAGFYISRRIMGSLSIENTRAEVEGFVAAVSEFQQSRGSLIRSVFR